MASPSRTSSSSYPALASRTRGGYPSPLVSRFAQTRSSWGSRWGLFRGGLNAHRSDRSPSFAIFFAQILVEILELSLFFERSLKSAQHHLCFEVVPSAVKHGLRVADHYCQYQSFKS